MSKQPPFVKWKIASHDVLPVGKKRRVDIAIEHHLSTDTYILIASLPKSGTENIVINQVQAESISETFKMDIINIR